MIDDKNNNMEKKNKQIEELELVDVFKSFQDKLDFIISKVEKSNNHFSDSLQTSVKIGDLCLSSPTQTIKQLNKQAIKLLKNSVVSDYLNSEKHNNQMNARPSFT